MPVRSESICPVFVGPDLSADNLELSNLSVSGQPSSDGYTVSVSFNIKNAGKEDINLTSKGIFVATRDPNGEKLDFGFTNGNTILKPGSTLKFNATTKIEKERRGLWEFYPSYEIWVQGTFMQKPVIIAKEGPKDWHACFFSYCPDYCKDNIRYYGGYIGQEETCVYKQEKCPAGCDSTEPKCAELPSPIRAVDTDGDGIKDENDQCPEQKETFNGYLDNDGCPDTLPVKDKTPPSVSVQHTPLDVNTSTKVTFTAKARDANGIASISIFVNGSKEKTCYGKMISRTIDKEGEFYYCTFEGGPYAAGSISYYAEAEDNSGNVGSSGLQNFQVKVIFTRPTPVVSGCFNSISGKILDFPFPREAIKMSLCEAEFLPMRPELGSSKWVCKSGSTTTYAEIGSHNSYIFENLCSGDFLVTPVLQSFASFCEPQGTFFNREMTQGGARKVSVPSETNADFVFVPRDQQAPAVDISVSPESATTEDEITITAIASDTSGIAKLEISGELSKIVRGVGHCRTERYEGHDIEICERYEHPINETIAQTCEADRCSFRIPRSDANYYKYEIKLRVSAYDRACNFLQRDFNLVFFKPAPIKMKNDRNTAAYREREVFLVSDQDWRNVLSLLPVALGTECEETPDFFPPVIGRSCYFEDTAIKTAVPFIIFHHEDNNGAYQGGFDLDSAIVFINQYKAKNVTVFVGDENLHQYLDDELYFWLIEPHNALQSRSRSLSENLNWFDRNPKAKIRFFDSRAISDVYKHYFSEINSVLVCEDNYEAALHCAVFAAKANMPLYFSGHYSLDDINGKIVHVAGNINPAEVRRIQAHAKKLGSFFNAYVGTEYESPYTIDQLSAGPKNVLAATTDYNKPDSFDFNFRPRVASYLKVSAFWRNSLAAPIYAVARNGVLETFSDIPVFAHDGACGSTNDSNHRYLKGITDTVKERTRYMLPFTIIASPPYIPDSYYTSCSGSAQTRAQMDREYGALGRIYGLTVTDTSAYIARSIFYDKIVKERPKLPTLLISHSISAAEGGISESVDRLKASPNYDVNCYIGSGKTGCVKDTKPTIETYLNKNLIVFANHGSIADWSSTLAFFEIPGVNNEYYLEAPVVFGDACLTNNFWRGLTSTMGPNWIRYGAIAYFGAAGISHSPACISGYSYNTTSEYFIEQISKGGRVWTKKSLGEVNSALDKCTEECCMAGVCWIDLCSYKDYFILLGDPALVPNFKVR